MSHYNLLLLNPRSKHLLQPCPCQVLCWVLGGGEEMTKAHRAKARDEGRSQIVHTGPWKPSRGDWTGLTGEVTEGFKTTENDPF